MKRVEESDTKLAQALSLVIAKSAEMKTMENATYCGGVKIL